MQHGQVTTYHDLFPADRANEAGAEVKLSYGILEFIPNMKRLRFDNGLVVFQVRRKVNLKPFLRNKSKVSKSKNQNWDSVLAKDI